MAITEDLQKELDNILRAKWETRSGQVVPETSDIVLGNSAVSIDATVLYADLADSTGLVLIDKTIAAEVFKAYLHGTTRIIRSNGGHIRSFDGDRVMGVFIGGFKNSSAAKTALQINHFFAQILVPKFTSFYSHLGSASYTLRQSVGVDTGAVHIIRSGIRNNNDLVWVGRGPNIAAKLCSIREDGYSSYITKAVYNSLADVAKISPTTGVNMWESRSWGGGQAYGVSDIYRSSWWVRP